MRPFQQSRDARASASALAFSEMQATPLNCQGVFNFGVASIAALCFAPLVGVLAVMIWLEDRGTPWFRQQRLGRDRTLFHVLKLRTMRNERVTRMGTWLRQTGLDELPQFVNVLRGEMSIVGPRPLTPTDVERLGWHGSDYEWRFSSAPGITGLSQLFGGVSARLSRRLDRLYLRRRSLRLDLQLIALSCLVNVCGKRAVRRWMRAR